MLDTYVVQNSSSCHVKIHHSRFEIVLQINNHACLFFLIVQLIGPSFCLFSSVCHIYLDCKLYFIQLFSSDTTKCRKYTSSFLFCLWRKHETSKWWHTLAFLWQFQYCPKRPHLPRHKKVQGSSELFVALVCS